MQKGELSSHVRTGVYMIIAPKYYESMGVESEWGRVTGINVDDPRVALSDEYAKLLWNLSITMVRLRYARCLVFMEGYPRILNLCLDPDTRDSMIETFRTDVANYNALAALEREWVDRWTRRSLFQKARAAQMRLCFDEVARTWCPRLRCS